MPETTEIAPTQSESLTRRTGRALGWSYAGVITRLVLSFGINILLARLLGPKPFGALAIANIIYGLGNLLASVGVGSALIQKEVMTERDVRFCFTAQMLAGGAVATLLLVSAPAWAAFFHQPEETLLLRVFSLLFLFQAFGTTATALLNREQDSRRIQINSIISYLISYLAIGVPLAIVGAGIWSLVVAQILQAFINSVLSYFVVRHSVAPLFHSQYSNLLLFGFRVLGANISSWGISNLDNAVVGRVAGPVSLGLYSRAFSLAALPAESIISTLLQVLLPAFSRVQSETAKLRKVYAAALGLVLIVLAPIFGALFAVPHLVILGLYGPKWTGAIQLFQPLALAIPINAIMAISGPLLAARGKPQREFSMQLISVVIAAITYASTVRISVLALSWAVLAVYIVRFVLLTGAVNREIGGRWSDLRATATPGFVLGILAGVLAKLIDTLLPFWSDPIRLFLVIVGTGIGVLFCFAMCSTRLLAPITERFPQITMLLPAKLRRFAQL